MLRKMAQKNINYSAKTNNKYGAEKYYIQCIKINMMQKNIK